MCKKEHDKNAERKKAKDYHQVHFTKTSVRGNHTQHWCAQHLPMNLLGARGSVQKYFLRKRIRILLNASSLGVKRANTKRNQILTSH